jgi:hypothetical protein
LEKKFSVPAVNILHNKPSFAVVCAERGFTISEAEVGYVTWPAIKAETAGRSRVSQATRILLFRKNFKTQHQS